MQLYYYYYILNLLVVHHLLVFHSVHHCGISSDILLVQVKMPFELVLESNECNDLKLGPSLGMAVRLGL